VAKERGTKGKARGPCNERYFVNWKAQDVDFHNKIRRMIRHGLRCKDATTLKAMEKAVHSHPTGLLAIRPLRKFVRYAAILPA
jgi:hypothetical protein